MKRLEHREYTLTLSYEGNPTDEEIKNILKEKSESVSDIIYRHVLAGTVYSNKPAAE